MCWERYCFGVPTRFSRSLYLSLAKLHFPRLCLVRLYDTILYRTEAQDGQVFTTHILYMINVCVKNCQLFAKTYSDTTHEPGQAPCLSRNWAVEKSQFCTIWPNGPRTNSCTDCGSSARIRNPGLALLPQSVQLLLRYLQVTQQCLLFVNSNFVREKYKYSESCASRNLSCLIF